MNVQIFTDNVDMENQQPAVQKYFSRTYEKAREKFLAAADQLKDETIVKSRFIVPSKIDNDLTIDAVEILPKKKKKRLFIVISGTHGVEGYAGSALQTAFLSEHIKERADDTGILLIHSVNPFGFKYFRRTTEQNIDLNRNYANDSSLFETKNPGYEELNETFNPGQKAENSFTFSASLFLKLIFTQISEGKKTLLQATTGGQYQNSNGIFYGGKEKEPQIEILSQYLTKVTKNYPTLLLIDLHTGFGKKSKLHFYQGSGLSPKIQNDIRLVFNEDQLVSGQDPDFYKVSGSFVSWTDKLFAAKRFIPMTFEFGTMNSQTLRGGFHSLKAMILENQGFHHGYESERDELQTREFFEKLFLPKDPEWRITTLNVGLEALELTLDRFDSQF